MLIPKSMRCKGTFCIIVKSGTKQEGTVGCVLCPNGSKVRASLTFNLKVQGDCWTKNETLKLNKNECML